MPRSMNWGIALCSACKNADAYFPLPLPFATVCTILAAAWSTSTAIFHGFIGRSPPSLRKFRRDDEHLFAAVESQHGADSDELYHYFQGGDGDGAV